jgi:hypothetical protein
MQICKYSWYLTSGDPDAPDEIEDEDAYDIEEVSSGGFKTRCPDIPAVLYASIIGTKGAVKKRIETETKTKIVIPRMNEKGDIGESIDRFVSIWAWGHSGINPT